MISTRRAVQSIRRWAYLGPLPFVAALAVAACGGKVVVDGSGNGEGGAGGTTESSAAVSPSTGSSTQNVCDAGTAHLKECSPLIGEIPPVPDCSGQVQCQFSCALQASCGGIVGSDQAATKQFADCLITCG